jgi:hypothetical protein
MLARLAFARLSLGPALVGPAPHFLGVELARPHHRGVLAAGPAEPLPDRTPGPEGRSSHGPPIADHHPFILRRARAADATPGSPVAGPDQACAPDQYVSSGNQGGAGT